MCYYYEYMHPIQEKILNLIEEKDISGMTLRAIGALVLEDSPQKIKHHLQQLERKGLISINKSNGKIISNSNKENIKNSSLVPVPIMGSANCGPQTCYADGNIEGYLKISKSFLPKDFSYVYLLRATGDSMNKANIKGKNIESGDYVLVDGLNKNPEDKAYVVSIIDNLANIKRLHIDQDHQQVLLLSESTRPTLPIVIHEDDEYSVAGRVVDVIKIPKL